VNESGFTVKLFIQAWREAFRFLGDSTQTYQIVIYSEGGGYDPFFRPLIDALAGTYDGIVGYLTSDAADPLLLNPPSHVRSFFIGKDSARTFVFNNLRADIVAMTMPDLNTFHIKRSRHVSHYAYIHHTPLSMHTIYRKGAFDHFDSILCTGPHHVEETREWEARNSLPSKQLFEHGYPPLDTLMQVAKDAPPLLAGKDEQLNILLAPSWGAEGLMETRAEETVRILLDAGHFVRVRPHPRTRQIAGPALDSLKAEFGGHPSFDMDEDTSKFEALLKSHLMISDWSGVVMEFAYGLERPVLFIDVPQRINNPDFGELTAKPFESFLREETGVVLSPDNLGEMPALLADLQSDAQSFSQRMRKLRAKRTYNIGTSARRGAEILTELAASYQSPNR
jgi:hypothetical protein